MLPKIEYPLITLTMYDKTKFMFRPILVREEKLLLMAKESSNDTDILNTIKQVVNNCAVDPKFNIDTIPIFLLEYIFLKLRGFSIGDAIEVSYRDNDDNKVYDFTINTSEIEIKAPIVIYDKVVKLNDKAGLVLRWPEAKLYDDMVFLQTIKSQDAFIKLIIKCIESIYDGDNVYDASTFTDVELIEFIELIDMASFQKIADYLNNQPTIYHELKYVNSSGVEKKIVLNSLADFFTLR